MESRSYRHPIVPPNYIEDCQIYKFIPSLKTWIYNNKYLPIVCKILQLHILHYFLRNLKNSSLKQQWAVLPTKTIMCKSEILCCCLCNFITTSKVIAIFRSKIVLFPAVRHSELRKLSQAEIIISKKKSRPCAQDCQLSSFSPRFHLNS